MSNSVVRRDDWDKVKLGLLEANIETTRIKELETKFNEMPPDIAGNVMDGGKYGISNAEHQKSRQLFRALNFLKAVNARRQGFAYGLDSAAKERFKEGTANIATLRTEVMNECNKLFAAQAPVLGIPVPVERATITTRPRPVVSTNTSEIQKVEGLLGLTKNGRLAQNVLLARDRFKSGLVARTNTAKSIVADSALVAEWLGAKQEIYNLFSANTNNWLFDVITINSATKSAYDNFQTNVAQNAAAIQSKLDVCKLLFSALEHAPPPISLLGKIGSAMAGQIKPGQLQTTPRYETLTSSKVKLVARMAELMEKYEQATTLVDLQSIPAESDISATLNLVSAAYLRKMQTFAGAGLDDIFGTHADAAARVDALKKEFIKEGGLSHVGGSMNAMNQGQLRPTGQTLLHDKLVKTVVTRYKQQTIEALEAVFTFRQSTVKAEDVRMAFEMWLYAKYICTLFQDGKSFKHGLSKGIVDFFIQTGGWGMLSPEDDHAISDNMRRLNWKEGENHKQMLHMFCQWYVQNINPFDLIVDVIRDDEPFTPELIQRLCREHIHKINQAKNAGRTQEWWKLGSSDWDWEKIRAKYISLCGSTRTKDDWLVIDIT